MRSLLLGTYFVLLLVPSQAALQTLPVFLWGSGDFVSHADQRLGLRTLYEVASSDDLTSDVLNFHSNLEDSKNGALLNQTALYPFQENLVTLFVFGQLGRADLNSKLNNGGAVASLVHALNQAVSSVFLPDVQSTQQQLLETVRAKSQAVLEVGDCTASEKGLTLQNLPSLLQGKPGRVSVAICGADLPEALSSVEGSLKEAGRPHLVVYAGQPEQALERPAARSLKASEASNAKDLCDRKCRIQVRLFEVIILLILLLVALGAGLGMLHILDTPTRFEQEKKETNRHHD